MIYHITTPELFENYNAKDTYEAPSLASEAFIHCSTFSQLKASAERYYKDVPEIVVLVIDEQKLIAKLKYELASNGEEFPHIYGVINKDAITETKRVINKEGSFNF